MKIEVDPNFKGSGRQAARRRRGRLMRRIAAGLGGVALLGGIAVIVLRPGAGPAPDAEEPVLVQMGETADGAVQIVAAGAEAFLNIRGAPMILTLPEGNANLGERRLVAGVSLEPGRFPAGRQFDLLEDALFDSTQRVQLSIPSSSADLAAFNARRSDGIALGGQQVSVDVGLPEEVSAGTEVDVEDGRGSWGEVIGDSGTVEAQEVRYIETVIENTTTSALSTPSPERQSLFREALEDVPEPRKLTDILTAQKLTETEIDRVLAALSREAEAAGLAIEQLTELPARSLVAMRVDDTRYEARLLQMSIYGPDGYLMTLVQPRPGRFVSGADPWFSRDLRSLANRALAARGTEGQLRLKDAIYSLTLRHQMPSDLVGELLVMLARVQDLDQIVDEKDRIRILYAEDGADLPAGRIAFAALTGPELDLKCYVTRGPREDAPYACFDPSKPQGPAYGGGGGLLPGFIVPVAGTKTSGFGPRFHPILKKTVSHNGLDWGAPVGTPVHAAAAGTLIRAEFSGAYGNIVSLKHANGYESRYAHLNAFADGVKVGDEVQAGALIGYVGTTGRSTGPHLHFEIRLNGAPIDPTGSSHGSQAVEALVNRIIRVESAGNARAQNARSSATGLGQFIDGTWIRMMNTYRPDLVRSLDRTALLELRFDPALSREMVTNLARENEAYLRARGHVITPGRLYLAHFLGPAGADVALKAAAQNPDAPVLDVMGSAVVRANPFLTGWSVSQMAAWADRKMNVSGVGLVVAQAATPSVPLTAETKRYVSAVDGLLNRL
ncbi:peptidoglycan DD-metalloendopeptidase family protein [Celeribacter naphthalenivorans]|uniref:peptidoglycan DD-metalloendopeptidase family protein n=1 Tax=Celeribacter naphthalenivorans TaxID=1614694 RepID=UPI001CFA6F7B|nr:peptidoglycan DD-metalloendopeptidase family protein [Celeribacter naphthalenivorans]